MAFIQQIHFAISCRVIENLELPNCACCSFSLPRGMRNDESLSRRAIYLEKTWLEPVEACGLELPAPIVRTSQVRTKDVYPNQLRQLQLHPQLGSDPTRTCCHVARLVISSPKSTKLANLCKKHGDWLHTPVNMHDRRYTKGTSSLAVLLIQIKVTFVYRAGCPRSPSVITPSLHCWFGPLLFFFFFFSLFLLLRSLALAVLHCLSHPRQPAVL